MVDPSVMVGLNPLLELAYLAPVIVNILLILERLVEMLLTVKKSEILKKKKN